MPRHGIRCDLAANALSSTNTEDCLLDTSTVNHNTINDNNNNNNITDSVTMNNSKNNTTNSCDSSEDSIGPLSYVTRRGMDVKHPATTSTANSTVTNVHFGVSWGSSGGAASVTGTPPWRPRWRRTESHDTTMTSLSTDVEAKGKACASSSGAPSHHHAAPLPQYVLSLTTSGSVNASIDTDLMRSGVQDLASALSGPVTLSLHANSAGGTYMVRPAATPAGTTDNTRGNTCAPVAVFKPRDEEIGQDGNPHGNTGSDRVDVFAPGSGSRREVLAYALDHQHRAGIPPTIEVWSHGSSNSINNSNNDNNNNFMDTENATDSAPESQIGSLQLFHPNCVEAADVLPGGFDVEEVHSLAIFDIRTLNGDRHGGNVLVHRGDGGTMHLVPVDHSYICPSGYADPDFEWLAWPQSRLPFSQRSVAYIKQLDAEADAQLVKAALTTGSPNRKPNRSCSDDNNNTNNCSEDDFDWDRCDDDVDTASAAAEVTLCTTRLLQIAVVEFGLTARDVGHLCRRPRLTLPSVLEELMESSRDFVSNWNLNIKSFEENVRWRLREEEQQQQQRADEGSPCL